MYHRKDIFYGKIVGDGFVGKFLQRCATTEFFCFKNGITRHSHRAIVCNTRRRTRIKEVRDGDGYAGERLVAKGSDEKMGDGPALTS